MYISLLKNKVSAAFDLEGWELGGVEGSSQKEGMYLCVMFDSLQFHGL